MEGSTPAQWTRKTRWRQGSFFTTEAIEQFGLCNSIDTKATCAVVISHDCDLANDNLETEPCVEFIVGRLIDQSDGNYRWGKTPRTLHYTVLFEETERHIEIISTQKSTVHKNELVRFEPDERYVMSGKSLAVLRSWLGSRYNRAAFPDVFVSRMQRTKADAKLSKAMEKGGFISFIYFDVDDGQNIERQNDDPYKLSIVLVFPSGEDANASTSQAETLALEIDNIVGQCLKAGNEISLKSVFAISEDDLPVSQAKLLTRWSLEHMTLRSDNKQLRPPSL